MNSLRRRRAFSARITLRPGRLTKLGCDCLEVREFIVAQVGEIRRHVLMLHWAAILARQLDFGREHTDVARNCLERLHLVVHLELKAIFAGFHAGIEKPGTSSKLARVIDVHLAEAISATFGALRMRRTVHIEPKAAIAIRRLLAFSFGLALRFLVFGLSPLIRVLNPPAMAAAIAAVLDQLVRVGCGDFPPPLQHHFLGDLSAFLQSLLAFCKVCGNLRFSQVFVPDRISTFGAIPGPNRRLRGVEIDQILIHKAALFFCQRHKLSF
ncbi:hypothetical protein WK91_18365 [Burkholderia cepacia]|nr:hypothetical protein WK91_18365 [Burkholderia cepacia]